MLRFILTTLLCMMTTPLTSAAAVESIRLRVGGENFTVELADTPAARLLARSLPLRLRMADLNANEKYGDLPQGLPTQAEAVGSIRTGDLMLFTPTCLVLFYKDFRTPYRYTRVGRVREAAALPAALGSGSVQIELSAQ